MKKINLFVIILLMAFVAIPVFAQNVNDNGKNDKANKNLAPTLISEKEGIVDEKDNINKPKTLREAIKIKKEKGSQFKSKIANEHRSAVANFVQSLLEISDRQKIGGIGEQVRAIASEQNESEDKVTPLMDKVKSKNKVRKFLFGTDFKKTKEIKKEMLGTKKRLDDLEKIRGGIASPVDRKKVEEEIDSLRNNLESVLSEVQSEENKFSLFGWVKKIFIK